jgi:hypothetical protein
MAAKLARLTHTTEIQLAPRGRELYHLQFSLQAVSPETFGYTLVQRMVKVQQEYKGKQTEHSSMICGKIQTQQYNSYNKPAEF